MEDLLRCPVCGMLLQEPYIRCFECRNPTRSFCLQCFAKGREYENHKNNHSYTVVRNNFAILDPVWMASEELKLLNAVADRGIGNWSEVSKDVGTKNKVECEEHYFKHYIYQPIPPLPEIYSQEMEEEVCHPTPVSCTTFSQDPPRPSLGSNSFRDMDGYMPARGDFSYEHDDFAEMDIKELAFEDGDPMWNDLQMAVLDIYQSRLKERARRKLLIKNYGLLNIKRNVDDWKRYSLLGNSMLDHMKPLMHLFTADNFYKFLEGLLWEHKAKQRIQILQECREAGITRPHSIPIFLKLKRKREESKRSKTALDEVLSQIKDERSCHQFLNRHVLKDGSSDGGPGRRSAPPLNIATMPDFEKLNLKERELCTNHRIMPSSYLQYKTTLLHEYGKLGYLRLANARKVIKIDVNKTRHIYDLLLEQGLITAPDSKK